ncbi:hypothetical protein BC827DRAFT_1168006 [Russula dissimulans]|nr:hypothetical protein BC827DRAFT_1168006 [Russula dissimulans]
MWFNSSLASSAIFFLPFVSAITFETPSNITSGGPATINWTPDSTDPDTFSLELVNPIFHNAFAIANNVRTAPEQLTDNYQIEAVQISNINDVFGKSSAFTIAPTVTTTSSSASTASPLSSVSGASPAAATNGATSSDPSNSPTSSGSSQASSTSPSSFNGNGALGRSITGGNVGSIAAAVLGIVAGAVLV